MAYISIKNHSGLLFRLYVSIYYIEHYFLPSKEIYMASSFTGSFTDIIL